MAINRNELEIAFNTYINTNIVPTYPVQFDGVEFTPTTDDWIRVKNINVQTKRTALTGSDVGIETIGFLRFSIYNKVGNSTKGREIAEFVEALFYNETITGTNVSARFFTPAQYTSVGESEQYSGYYESYILLDYEAFVGS